MPPQVLFDTDVLIDASRGRHEATKVLADAARAHDLAISAVTKMELIVGCRDRHELRATEQFVRRFIVVDIDEPTSGTAVGLLAKHNLSHGLAIPDALIAATAITNGLRLVSKNQKDFRYLSGLDLAPYPPTF